MIKGYKILRDNLLCVLSIDPLIANLDRQDVVDKNFAKFRCQRAKVTKIYDLSTHVSCPQGSSIFDPNFIYTNGHYVNVYNYEKDADSICAPGIHFFLSKEAACNWYNTFSENKFHDNGHPSTKRLYKNGKLSGLYKEWYDNGQIRMECNYFEGFRNGLYKSYYDTGDIETECFYKDGAIFSYMKKWYKNGQLEHQCKYSNGLRHGIYRSYHKNGELYVRCLYREGKIMGSYTIYSMDGTVVDQINYDKFKDESKISLDSSQKSWSDILSDISEPYKKRTTQKYVFENVPHGNNHFGNAIFSPTFTVPVVKNNHMNKE